MIDQPTTEYERLRLEHEELISQLRGIVHEMYEHPRRPITQGKIGRRPDALWEGC